MRHRYHQEPVSVAILLSWNQPIYCPLKELPINRRLAMAPTNPHPLRLKFIELPVYDHQVIHQPQRTGSYIVM